ncbi:MAG: hypothetical protein GY749_19845, partial [Desulfobacteraceae bacterium]|nr:hypothetical protein [Desulfobacteraceae bacterium]
MANLNAVSENTEKEQSSDIKKCKEACKEMFDRIVSHILEGGNQEAHKMEESIFRKVMELGNLLLQLYFASHHESNYGETIETAQGTAERGRTSEKTYFSIFSKLKVVRYLYHIGDMSFAPLDIALNLPVRCYSYFLSECANLLNINGSYEKASELLKKFFGLNLY